MLTWAEVHHAALVGVSRRLASMERGLNANVHAPGKSDWATDIDGASSELAVAKCLGMYWPASVNDYKSPDVGVLHVRSTKAEGGHLIVRQNDVVSARYVLVRNLCPVFFVMGSKLGSDAMVDRYWRDSGGGVGAWWVPASDLEDEYS